MLKYCDIIKDNNPDLRVKCEKVELPLSDEDLSHLLQMNEYLEKGYEENAEKKYDIRPGVGIAAPQIDVLKNMFVILAYDEKGVEPSGGQAQKLAIARAVYRDAPVVILDEPTAALDPIAEYEIYRQFNSLVGGKSAFYISHRLSSCQFCDRIAVFSDGHIAEYGTHAELEKIPGGIYSQMFEAQARYYKG